MAYDQKINCWGKSVRFVSTNNYHNNKKKLSNKNNFYLKYFFLTNFKIAGSLTKKTKYKSVIYCKHFVVFFLYFNLFFKKNFVFVDLITNIPFKYSRLYVNYCITWCNLLYKGFFIKRSLNQHTRLNDLCEESLLPVKIYQQNVAKKIFFQNYRNSLDRISTFKLNFTYVTIKTIAKERVLKVNFHYFIFTHFKNHFTILKAPFRDKIAKNILSIQRFFIFFLFNFRLNSSIPLFSAEDLFNYCTFLKLFFKYFTTNLFFLHSVKLRFFFFYN